MAIYLKKFETQAAYEAAQSGLILPNVSLTVDNNTVHYNPSSPIPPTPPLFCKLTSKFVGTIVIDGSGELTENMIWDSVDEKYEIESVEIGILCTSIGDNVFNNCQSLTSCTISNSVTSIGYNAFGDCLSLTSIDIPNSVTSIGDGAFYMNNSELTELTSVTVRATTPPTLGSDAFGNNASGRKIYVPSTSVGTYKSATNWSTYASDIEPIS